MKKLINDADAVVREALEAAHSDKVRVIHDPAVIVRADAPVQGKVGIISGGGSGHEPMHGGFVGRGMLDGACPGAVFTSPTPDQMLEASKAARAFCTSSRTTPATCSTSRWRPISPRARASTSRPSSPTTTSRSRTA